MNQESNRPLYLKGGPRRLAAVLRLSADESQALSAADSMRVSLGVAERVNLGVAESASVKIRPATGADSGVSLLKLKLPKVTPPGIYEGTVEVGGSQLAVVIEVEPRPRLRVIPRRLRLQGTAGAEVTTDINVVNVGNVALNIESEYTFCIFDPSGLNRAFYFALANDSLQAEKRVSRLMDKLAESHGGLARVRVEGGAGEIPVGDARNLQLTFILPERMRPGLIYSGALKLFNHGIPVEVTDVGSQSSAAQTYAS
jgi:hypothetical protein